MPLRFVWSPMRRIVDTIRVDIVDDTGAVRRTKSETFQHRMPHVEALRDRGEASWTAPDGRTIDPVLTMPWSASSSGQPGERNDGALCLVWGADLTELDLAPGMIDIFETTFAPPVNTFINSTPRSLGWNPALMRRVVDRLDALGAASNGVDLDMPIFLILDRIIALLGPGQRSSANMGEPILERKRPRVMNRVVHDVDPV